MSPIGSSLPNLSGDGQPTQVQIAVAIKAQKLARSQQAQVLELIESVMQTSPQPPGPSTLGERGLNVVA